MLKHIGHSHHSKLHTFDDFYRDSSKPIKSRSPSNDLISTNNSVPTSPCSPNSNPYTFYNIFADFKPSITPDVVPEEDETEPNNEIIGQASTPPTAVFYLEDDHQHHPQTSSSSTTPSSSHWPSLLLNRFRHSNSNHHHHHHHGMMKQNSVNENQMNSAKLRKSDMTDSSTNKHRFLKRSETINSTNGLSEKKLTNDDFPELCYSTNPSSNNHIDKKHRSFVSLFHHLHSNNHHQNAPRTDPNRSSSTGTLHLDKVNPTEFIRPKPTKQKTLNSNPETHSPVKKSSPTPMLPKIASFFHCHYLTEHHKYRIGNLKARLHHRRKSPPLTNVAPKFQCQASNELIEEIKQLEEQNDPYEDYVPSQRPAKPVVMKRVHTWHNSFNLQPVDQCLEY